MGYDIDYRGLLMVFSGSYLGLWETGTGDTGLAHVSGLVGLESLGLGGGPRFRITDAGFVHLGRLVNLKRLRLIETEITDVGLAHLRDLRSLEELELDEPLLTDGGILQLKGLPRLARLSLRRANVSDALVADFQGLGVEVISRGSYPSPR